MEMRSPPEANADPRRYFESVGEQRGDRATRQPVCVYLETTNRCNLLCTTCPRTYEELEPPADMSWELFTSIVDQIPDLAARGFARGRRTHAGEEPAEDGALSQGARDLRAVQHQRHSAQREERPGADRGWPRRAARVARCIQREILSGHSRQGLFQPNPQERSRLPQPAGTRGQRSAAGLGLAHGIEGDRSPNCRPSCRWLRRSE